MRFRFSPTNKRLREFQALGILVITLPETYRNVTDKQWLDRLETIGERLPWEQSQGQVLEYKRHENNS